MNLELADDRLGRFYRLLRLSVEDSKERASHPFSKIGVHVYQKAGSLQTPLVVMLDLTSQCNQNCIFCYRSGPRGLMPHGQPRHQPLKIIDSLCQQFAEMGVASVTLSGGEPTCHPDFLSAIAIVKDYDLSLTIMTNGINLTEATVRRLAKILDYDRDRFELSFDAVRKGSYQKIRGSDKFSSLMSTLEWFKHYQIPFVTITIVVRENVDQIEEILTVATKHGAVDCAIETPFPKSQIPAEVYASQEQMLELYERVSLFRSAGPKISLDLLHFSMSLSITREVISFLKQERVPLFICHAGHASCAVDILGNVHLCQFVINSNVTHVGNLFETPFAQLWREVQKERQLLERQAREFGCRDCAQFEICRGGCPAIPLEAMHRGYQEPCYSYDRKLNDGDSWNANLPNEKHSRTF